MKRVILFAGLFLAMIVGRLVLFEVFRDKGQIQVSASASRCTNGEVALTLAISNLDWRVSLDRIHVSLEVEKGFTLRRVLKPDNVQTATNFFGPANDWEEIVICYPPGYVLKPKQAVALECFLIPGSMSVTNRISGWVSYRGAQIWERVGMGQMNGLYFQVPIRPLGSQLHRGE